MFNVSIHLKSKLTGSPVFLIVKSDNTIIASPNTQTHTPNLEPQDVSFDLSWRLKFLKGTGLRYKDQNESILINESCEHNLWSWAKMP